jgi:hypothetical protein
MDDELQFFYNRKCHYFGIESLKDVDGHEVKEDNVVDYFLREAHRFIFPLKRVYIKG